MRPPFRAIFHLLSDVRIQGKENIPKKGPYLVASNHISLFEPPFILAFWPEALEAAGAVEIWERPGQNILVRLYGGIPVHRGEYDRRLVERLIGVLNSGFPLLIAPEGGRTHTIGMRRANPGAAYIVDQTHVPVVPVGIQGTSDDFLRKALQRERPRLEMHIGAPFYLPPVEGRGEARRIARQHNADIIMQHIAELLPADYHGVYSDELEPAEFPPVAKHPIDLHTSDDVHA
jgi:1-acyl-sn-glycerol-3-phosphate acyltransferase